MTADAASIMDLGPTVLKYFNQPVPKEMDGKPLF
jgi:bisphosphoglycerate-independent phosphoglycerate mutase (AlkP superfamily)